MKAIILAAGRSTRLYPLTLERPKCLLEVGGETIIEGMIRCIREIGIEDITVIVGYKKEMIMDVLGGSVKFREYSDFAKTNNFHTLWSVKDELNTDFMCFFADLIFDTEVIRRAKDSQKDICLVIDKNRVLEGTMRIKLTAEKLTGVGSHITVSDGSGNFLGIAKFSKKGAKILLDQMDKMASGCQSDYYTIAIDELARGGTEVGYVDISDKLWLEVDTKNDLERARSEIKLKCQTEICKSRILKKN